MASHSSSRKATLVLTHNFPRYPGDMSGVFLKHLLSALAGSVDFSVVAPHDRDLPVSETIDGMEINRFVYAAEAKEIAAYRGEMHRLLLSKPLLVWKFLRAYRGAAMRSVKERSFDSIWAHWWIPGGWIGLKAREASGKPLIVTCHGTDIFLLNKFKWLVPIAARVFSAAARITVVSNFLKEQLISSMTNRVADIEGKTLVAPMPVDRGVFSFDEKVTPEPGSIICASRLTEQKHIDKLIRAISRLRADGINCRVDIYGDGPQHDRLERLAAESDLSQQIHIHKPLPQKELAEKYRKSEIAVLVSEREGFGLSLLEAMLCGCAGVGADSGGITDIIETDGVDGVLVVPGDVESLYLSLKDLLTNRGKLEGMRRTCRESAVRRFAGNAISQRFFEALDQL